jgi:hypothetical protein
LRKVGHSRIEKLSSFPLCQLLEVHLLNYYYIIAEEENQTNNETQADLSYDLELTLQAGFILFENFNVVINKTDDAKPDCSD